MIVYLEEFSSISSFSLRNKLNGCEFIILEGSIYHSSGEELEKNLQYSFSALPKSGYWIIEKKTKIYCINLLRDFCSSDQQLSYQESYSNTNMEVTDTAAYVKQKKIEISNSLALNTIKKFLFLKERINNLIKQVGYKFNNYPFYRQTTTMDCGAACLMMVCRYWGKNLDYQQIIELAEINRSGVTLQKLFEAGEFLGFKVLPGQSDLPGLEKNSLPAIAHWDGNHYVVVYKINKKQVIIGDPKIGQRFLTRENFVNHWTGYGLWLEPTSKFYQQENSDVRWSQFTNLLRPYKVILLEVFIASLVLNIIGLISPILTQILLDQVITYQSISTFWAIGFAILISRIFQELFLALRRYLLFHTANKLDLTLIVSFITHILKLPLSYFESRYVGDLTSRIAENRKIRQFITTDALTVILDIGNIFLFAGLMFYYSWKLSFIALSIVPILLVTTLVFTPLLKSLSRQVFGAGAKESSYLIEFLSGISTIKSLAIDQSVRFHWENLINKYINVSFTNQMLQEKLSLGVSLSEGIISTLVLLLGVWYVIHNQLTLGELIAFNMLVGQVIAPFKRLSLFWYDFQEIRIAIERCDDVLKAKPETGLVDRQLIDLKKFTGSVVFENVNFRYDTSREQNSIDNLSFEIMPGQTVAIVGKSGSGKTTISKLLLGLYLPQSGKIVLDDYCLSNLSLSSLRKQTAIVNQDIFLFGGTIKENLLIASPYATPEAIEKACTLACAKNFIDELPLRYDTQIGEGGGLLSGGQRQRLAIARALLRKPSLLILDEATSNLDTESERIIQENLRHVLANQTTLIIAHRLSTVKSADLILVMAQGKLIESGNHQELMARQQAYYYLASQQLGV